MSEEIKTKECPVCGSPSTKQDSYNWKCRNNHVFRHCFIHKKPVITSLIGELTPRSVRGCCCHLDVLKNPDAVYQFEREKQEQERLEKDGWTNVSPADLADGEDVDDSDGEEESTSLDGDDTPPTTPQELENENENTVAPKIKVKPEQNVDITIKIITPEGTKTFVDKGGCGSNCCSPHPHSHHHPHSHAPHFPISVAPRRALPSEQELEELRLADFIKQRIEDQYGVILSAAKTVSKKPKNPTAKNPPLHISEQGKKLWPDFVKDYAKAWKKYSDTKEKWAVAVAIWRNYAVKRNVPPFEDTAGNQSQDGSSGGHDQASSDYMKNRIAVAYKKTTATANTFISAFEDNYADRVLKQVLDSVEATRNGMYRIDTSRRVKTDYNLKDKGLRNWLKSKKFNPKNGKFVREISGLAILSLEEDDSTLYLKAKFKFPAQLVALALNISQDTLKNDKPKVIKQLTKLFKNLMKGN